ncbi:MAG: GntR family transcriptional regulator [Deltaproteobacteria bacterium]|nr:GntR family transcriptional regulator [Deltaproteobacteria bacterium]
MRSELASFQQQAHNFVSEQIINLGFKPGEFITDAQITEQLKINRTPVREAFLRLE